MNGACPVANLCVIAFDQDPHNEVVFHLYNFRWFEFLAIFLINAPRYLF